MNEQKKKSGNGLPEQKPRKELTEQQQLQRRKMIVFPLMLLVFAGSMWLIFAPTEKERQAELAGLNTDLPRPEAIGIVSDKRDAYEQEAIRVKRQEKVRTLEDFAFLMDGSADDATAEQSGCESLETVPAISGSASRLDGSGTLNPSVRAYHDLNRQLGSFYDTPEAASEEKEAKLQARIEQLERQLEERQMQQQTEEQQLALIEKSYQLASRYMNGDKPATAAGTAAEHNRQNGKKTVAQPVSRIRHNVVSRLPAPISDSAFVEEFIKPRNWGFNTVAGVESVESKNSIAACIYRTMIVTDGAEVPLRITEPMTAGGVLIPANTVLTGTARIDGQRMMITVSAVQHVGNVIPVELAVYDMDGGEGISVPASDEISAVKEIAANVGSGLGSSITITDDAGTQFLSDLGRSVIQGTAQYVGQKMRQVRVTLKAGYRVLLLPPLE